MSSGYDWDLDAMREDRAEVCREYRDAHDPDNPGSAVQGSADQAVQGHSAQDREADLVFVIMIHLTQLVIKKRKKIFEKIHAEHTFLEWPMKYCKSERLMVIGSHHRNRSCGRILVHANGFNGGKYNGDARNLVGTHFHRVCSVRKWAYTNWNFGATTR